MSADEQQAFGRLTRFAKKVADELSASGRPYDSYHRTLSRNVPQSTRYGFLWLQSRPDRKRIDPVEETIQGWRFSVSKREETSRTEPGRNGYCSYVRVDEELWLLKSGQLRAYTFRYEQRGKSDTGPRDLDVKDSAFTPSTAAWHDFTHSWRESNSKKGGMHLWEGWVTTGRRKYDEPHVGVSKLLSDLRKGSRRPSAGVSTGVIS